MIVNTTPHTFAPTPRPPEIVLFTWRVQSSGMRSDIVYIIKKFHIVFCIRSHETITHVRQYTVCAVHVHHWCSHAAYQTCRILPAASCLLYSRGQCEARSWLLLYMQHSKPAASFLLNSRGQYKACPSLVLYMQHTNFAASLLPAASCLPAAQKGPVSSLVCWRAPEALCRVETHTHSCNSWSKLLHLQVLIQPQDRLWL